MSSTEPAIRARPFATVGCPVVPLLVLTACGWLRNDALSEADMPERTIQEVQEAHADEWMAIPGVVGTGIGLCKDDEPCIRIYLSEPSPEAEERISDRVEGYRVELVVSGHFRPRSTE